METLSQALPESVRPALKELFEDFSMAGQKGAGTDIKVIKGFQLSPGFAVEPTEYAFDQWNLKEGDVLLASFPKTGTNWTLEILRHLLYPSDEDYKISTSLPLAMWLLEAGTVKKFPIMDHLPLKRRMFGTHLNAELVNVEKYTKAGAKIIYVMRNPKDQIVSWYNFIQNIPMLKNHPLGHMINNGFDKFFDNVVQGNIPICTKEGQWYPDHILSWYKHKYNENVYFLYFEDLKKDFQAALGSLAKFLGVELTAERSAEIEKKCSIEFMKGNIDKQNSGVREFQNINMRKGEVGSWKYRLTAAQSDLMDEKLAEALAETDIKFTYTL